MTIKFERQAAKQIEALGQPAKSRIKSGIDNLPKGDIKKLQGYTSTYRLRVGDYRIIFEISSNVAIIKAVLHRSLAYKNL
jgi:mRNA interferase RelE/StbE